MMPQSPPIPPPDAPPQPPKESFLSKFAVVLFMVVICFFTCIGTFGNDPLFDPKSVALRINPNKPIAAMMMALGLWRSICALFK